MIKREVPPKGQRPTIGEREIDTYGINSIICPYCGYERDSIWDDTEDGMEFEEQEAQCGECEEYFLLNCTPFIDCVFTSEKREEDKDGL